MATALRIDRPHERMTNPAPAVHESDLVARAQRGEVDAFEALYRTSSGRVFAICLRMTGDRQRATELLQDVFVKVWERIGGFRGESEFSSWVHRIAVNVVLETGRKESRKQSAESRSVGEVELAVPSSIEDRLDLDAAIGRLPPGARRAFVLHDVEGYKHHEIAKMTGLAEGTLRAQLHRARQLLMEMLR
jgi:RNA polymerase sigma-70 factor (ECF subfamily)